MTREDLRSFLIEFIAKSGSRDAACRFFVSGTFEQGELPMLYACVLGEGTKKPLDGIKEL